MNACRVVAGSLLPDVCLIPSGFPPKRRVDETPDRLIHTTVLKTFSLIGPL